MSEEKRIAKPLTNGDRFRAMSNEELAGLYICTECLDWTFVCNHSKKSCKECLIDWLNSPVESEVNDATLSGKK